MKRWTRILLFAAVSFLTVGLALGFASLCAGFRYDDFRQAVAEGRFEFVGPAVWWGNEIQWIRSDPEEAEAQKESGQTYTGTFGDVRTLELKAGQTDCSIIPYDEDVWTVKGSGLSALFRCRMDGSELEIDSSDHFWNSLGLGNNRKPKLELYVPRDQIVDEVKIETGVGTLQIASEEAFFRCRELELKCGTAQAVIFADIQKEAEIETGVGEIKLSLAGEQTDFDYEFNSGAGSILLDGEILPGEHEIDNHADKELKLTCSTGSAEIVFGASREGGRSGYTEGQPDYGEEEPDYTEGQPGYEEEPDYAEGRPAHEEEHSGYGEEGSGHEEEHSDHY